MKDMEKPTQATEKEIIMSIFLVTTMYRGENDEHQRTVGYFLDKSFAEETVLNNYGDIYEHGHYNLAVIEEVPEGLYQYDIEPDWYSVEFGRDEDSQARYTVRKIDTPDFAKNLVGFSIG